MHTDRGSEYTAGLVRQACARLGIAQSTGRPGSALDNAVIESWHSTLEFELRSVERFATRVAARARVSAWIEDYNTRRRHSALAMMSPAGYEQALKAGQARSAKSKCPRFQGNPAVNVSTLRGEAHCGCCSGGAWCLCSDRPA
jgi:hypothetical protein